MRHHVPQTIDSSPAKNGSSNFLILSALALSFIFFLAIIFAAYWFAPKPTASAATPSVECPVHHSESTQSHLAVLLDYTTLQSEESLRRIRTRLFDILKSLPVESRVSVYSISQANQYPPIQHIVLCKPNLTASEKVAPFTQQKNTTLFMEEFINPILETVHNPPDEYDSHYGSTRIIESIDTILHLPNEQNIPRISDLLIASDFLENSTICSHYNRKTIQAGYDDSCAVGQNLSHDHFLKTVHLVYLWAQSDDIENQSVAHKDSWVRYFQKSVNRRVYVDFISSSKN